MDGKFVLTYLSIKNNGDWDRIYDDIRSKLIPSDEEIMELVNNVKSKFVTILDEDYPPILKGIYKPPFVLYYYGDISMISNPGDCVSVVGTRKPSEYGTAITTEIVVNLAKKKVIISGLALGVDALAHSAAINSGGKTAAVLGSGIDYCYPLTNEGIYKKIKETQLLISEYPGNSTPTQNNFPMRNRIVAALSKSLLITEAFGYRSGTSITAGYALSLSNKVMCIPQRAGCNSYCNKLINEGAYLVENADDILYFISDSFEERKFDL